MLSLQHFSVAYGLLRALAPLTVNLPAGEVVGLIGPNGSGKSTLLKALAGLVGYRGEAHWNGESLRAMAPRRRAECVSYLPQQVMFSQPFRVEEVVLMGCYSSLDRWGSWTPALRKRVDSALERVGATALARRNVVTLSGGEAQRVRLAQALAQGAELMLLDEPTSALDLQHQLELTALLHSLQQDEGKTQIVALHDLNLARKLCSRLWLLERGELRQAGKPEEVLLAPEFRDVYGVEVEIFASPTGEPVVWPRKIDQS